jgi:isocitrate/isopropylmalate dehydrogenase
MHVKMLPLQCITLIEGDGIGPEIPAAVVEIFEAATPNV